MTPERLKELAQYNQLGRAGGFMALISPPTVEEMNEVFELAMSVSGDREDGLRGHIQALVDHGPHWSPHPDIRDRVPIDAEWGASLVAVADLRAALVSPQDATPEPEAYRHKCDDLCNPSVGYHCDCTWTRELAATAGPCPRCGRPDAARSCPDCYAEFRAADREGLDVEQLVRALELSAAKLLANGIEEPNAAVLATVTAAEYARLQTKEK